MTKKYKEHQQMLPIINELRAHYKKLQEHLGGEEE